MYGSKGHFFETYDFTGLSRGLIHLEIHVRDGHSENNLARQDFCRAESQP
jgi:hypothetical protein